MEDEFYSSQMKPVTIVYGMHRSGTSLLTEILAKNGLNVGEESDLLGADIHNPRGYFEYKPILLFNEKALKTLGFTWYRPPTNKTLDIPSQLISEGIEVWQKARAKNIEIFKEPRFGILFPLWKRIWEMVGEQPKSIMIVRNPRQVAKSLQRIYQMPLMFGEKLWSIYQLRIIDSIEPTTENIIFHHKLIAENNKSEIEKISRFMNQEISSLSILNRELVRFNENEEPVDLNTMNIWSEIVEGKLSPDDYLSNKYAEDFLDVMTSWQPNFVPSQLRAEIDIRNQELLLKASEIRNLKNEQELLELRLRSIELSRIWRFSKFYRKIRSKLKNVFSNIAILFCISSISWTDLGSFLYA